jgi:hypothetical protein
MISRSDSMDFLSYHFFGARNPETPDSALMDAGVRGLAGDLPYQLAPRAVYQLISRTRSRANTPIFITECAPTAHRERSGESRDARLTRVISSAWWMSFLMNAARWIDLVCVYDLTEDTWGFLDAQGRAFPAFYATWIFSTYAPPGSRVCKTESSSPGVMALAVKTKTAHNLILVNTTPGPLTVSVAVNGIARPISMVRTRGVQDTNGLKASYLDRTTTQQIAMNGFAVEMVQFVESTP